MNSYQFGFLLGSLNGAGAEKTILTLAKALTDKGHLVDLYLLNNQGDYEKPEKVNILEVSGDKHPKQSQSLHQLTAQKHYDLFISSRGEFYDAVAVQNKYCSVHITPTAWIKHPGWQFWKTKKKLKKLISKFNHKRLIALSQGIKSDLTENLKCKSENITVINNPFEINEIIKLGGTSGDIPDQPYIIYVASFIERKRHSDLLRAFAKLKNQSIKLLLLGKGPLENEIKSLAKELNISDRLIFWGWDKNPYRLIKHASLSLLASEAEGLPRVVVESLQLKTPVVSTDCPSGPSEVLTGELKPFLVPVGNIDVMRSTIDTALETYPEIDLEKIAYFDAAVVADKYITLAKEAVEIV